MTQQRFCLPTSKVSRSWQRAWSRKNSSGNWMTIFLHLTRLRSATGLRCSRRSVTLTCAWAVVPETNRSHPIDACLAAFEMQQLIARTNRERKKLHLPRWDLRVGLHTGPVIAGVVGRRKFIYDVWGDAVNIAARMESAGTAGKINVSEAIYHRTKDLFDFDPRGSVEAKNKGQLQMFFLLRIKASLARDAEGHVPSEAFFAA